MKVYERHLFDDKHRNCGVGGTFQRMDDKGQALLDAGPF
jgi:hypothetical protein